MVMVVVMVMMMMSMCFSALRSANGGYSTGAILVTFAIFLFGLPAFPSCLWGSSLSDWFLMRRLNVLTTKIWVRKRYLSARRSWARDANTAYTHPYARKHTAKFALDRRFPRWPLRHGLRSLYRLWQRRYTSLAVNFLDS